MSERKPIGKTEVWNRIRRLHQELDEIMAAMYKVVDEFKQIFRAPWPMHLSVQKLKTGAVYLRWRKSGVKGRQPYLQLESATALKLLRAQPAAVRRQYLRFHQILLELNLSHSVCLCELRRLERYADQLKAFQGLKSVVGE
ncbi:hypothetical protein [Methylocaldum sp.]|uniref:hypothetical protein n=1 Tax=Methylocaldum sp. TaxID=1969727 RepID=UPI002D3B0EEB|nr:hypothetical protein [Methylocaldum sp.]HYE34796.1 hypothetical protein [Methylocaldum sp.]